MKPELQEASVPGVACLFAQLKGNWAVAREITRLAANLSGLRYFLIVEGELR